MQKERREEISIPSKHIGKNVHINTSNSIKEKFMEVVIAFLAGAVFGAMSVICWALCKAQKDD